MIKELKILITFAFTLTVIAFFTLMFFVFKNLFALYIEKRHKIIGYRFKRKIVAIFVVMVSIPTVLLFLVASGLLKTYIDRWFSPQIKEPIELSFQIAKTLYERERERTLLEAKRILKGEKTLKGFTVKRLYKIPDNASETIKEGFEGIEGTEVLTTKKADIIRAVVPIKKGSKIIGIIIVEQKLPMSIVKKAEKIKTSYQQYMTFYRWRLPLKLNYFIALGFFTLLIIFMALWASFKVSRWITDPVQKLANATEAIAKGNLDVRVDLQRDDEIGLLVNSFNKMVSELKESKEALEKAYVESDRRRVYLENIITGINSGVIYMNEKGKIVTINPSAVKMLKVADKEVLNQSYETLLKNVKSDELKNFIKDLRIHEIKSINKDFKVIIEGKAVDMRVFIRQLRDRDEKTIGLLVVFDDITEILKAKQALMWKEVARKLAHEIKNPLTPIKLSTERLLRKWHQSDVDFGKILETSAKTIIREVEGLQKLINNFSKFGRLPDIKKAPTDLKTLINEVLTLYLHIQEKILLDIKPPLPKVEVDRQQLKRAIINLIDNAVSATKDEGEITLKVSAKPDINKVYIKIADTGIGIKDEMKEKLFFPYFSTKKNGTGLGLAIVHRIITEHGGSITVSDNSPKGTVFHIELPIRG